MCTRKRTASSLGDSLRIYTSCKSIDSLSCGRTDLLRHTKDKFYEPNESHVVTWTTNEVGVDYKEIKLNAKIYVYRPVRFEDIVRTDRQSRSTIAALSALDESAPEKTVEGVAPTVCHLQQSLPTTDVLCCPAVHPSKRYR
ncbi:hypothetical protein J6590_003271 [Homalodisca vitripennis]|nr:hypothetical protein J6590_003271 [Homalodisca vitripennis]